MNWIVIWNVYHVEILIEFNITIYWIIDQIQSNCYDKKTYEK